MMAEEDWRKQLTIDDRKTLVQKIVSVLKDCVTDPNTNSDEARLSNLAAKFEETVYNNAENKAMYFNDIAKKMYHLKAKSTSGARKMQQAPGMPPGAMMGQAVQMKPTPAMGVPNTGVPGQMGGMSFGMQHVVPNQASYQATPITQPGMQPHMQPQIASQIQTQIPTQPGMQPQMPQIPSQIPQQLQPQPMQAQIPSQMPTSSQVQQPPGPLQLRILQSQQQQIMHQQQHQQHGAPKQLLDRSLPCLIFRASCSDKMSYSYAYPTREEAYYTSKPLPESAVSAHMRNVFAGLTSATAAAAAGVYAQQNHLVTGASLWTTLASFALLFVIVSTSDPKRGVFGHVLLSTFGFCQGLSLGPLIGQVYYIDPSIVQNAMVGTAIVFGSFMTMALLDRTGSYLGLGGFLMSALSLMFWMSLFNTFFVHSRVVFDIQLYGGLLLFSGFVLYDTQKIMAKARSGPSDYAVDGLTLFLDLVNIFTRILIILAKNKGQSNSNNNDRRRRE